MSLFAFHKGVRRFTPRGRHTTVQLGKGSSQPRLLGKGRKTRRFAHARGIGGLKKALVHVGRRNARRR